MRVLAISLLIAGWLIVLTSIVLLGKVPTARIGFLISGLLIEAFGFACLVRAHLPARGAGKW